jgi:protein SCO1/2
MFGALVKGAAPLISTETAPPKTGFLLCVTIALISITGAGLTMLGCESNTESIEAYSSAEKAHCLPNLVLTDQNGHQVSLASLKGKPVLFDFIYTTCPGPCSLLTTRMKAIADQFGPGLGSKAWFVSITVDPEHDGPSDLRAYAKQQGAERRGWLFLTGSPAEIDRLMGRFKLRRQREADGSVDHVLEFFLVAADGHQILQYLASDVSPAKVAGDLENVIDGKQLAASASRRRQLLS